MMLFDKLIVFVFAVVVAAVPFEVDDRFGHIAERATYYSSSWNDGKGKVVYKNGPEGQYSVTWSGNKGNFVVGKGWNPGGSRIVAFNGTFAPNGNAYLCVYGWTTSPLVEYYIIENYGSHAPWDNRMFYSEGDLYGRAEQKSKGNVTVDGSTYTLWTKMRINKPSIQGTATFPQFWSVRDADDLRSGGSVDTGAHFKAWADNGLKLGRQNYMIVAVEGQDSNGTASVNVGVAP